MRKNTKKTKNKIKIRYTIFPTELGDLFIAATDKGICKLHWPANNKLLKEVENTYHCELVEDPTYFTDIIKQINSYLASELKDFHCKIDFIKGTMFQKKVWNTLLKIPYGEIRSYQWVAERIGCPKGYRAVGGANHDNPIPLIVPCHRVIGKDGSMVGYGGPSKEGQDRKAELLRMEGAIV